MSTSPVASIEVKSADEPYLVRRPQGYYEYQLPISSKGVLIVDDQVLLVGNSRGELELPGGKIEKGESPEHCAQREVAEEVGLAVSGAQVLHAWVYEILANRHVFVIAYGVTINAQSTEELRLLVDKEVGSARWVRLDDVGACAMPREYMTAIRIWAERLNARTLS
jgi:8-oxo-dGTP pyrophosphatase MutT (NUDIX family)